MSFIDDKPKRLRFYDLTNKGNEITSNVISDSFTCEDFLCTEQLNIGECNSARIQFETEGNLELTGHKIRITYSDEDGSAIVGTYKITYTSTKINSNVCKLTGYDAVKEFDKDVYSWWKNLVDSESFPITISALRASLCAFIGITQETVTLINDSLQINDTMDLDALNGRELLKWIGQLNGVFPHATKEYNLKWISLDNSSIGLIPPSLLIGAQGYEGKDYQTATITGVLISYETGAVGGIAGSAGNRIEIYGNALAYGRSDLNAIAQSLYNKLKNVRYTPSQILIKYFPNFSLGKLLEYNNKQFYNFGMKLESALECEIICDGNEYLENEESVDTEIKILKGKSNVFTRDLDSLNSTITETRRAQSVIQQEVDTITLSVEDLTKAIDNEETLYYVEGEPTLTNYPAIDFTLALPVYEETDEKCVKLTAEGIKLEYKDEWYKKYSRSLAYDVIGNLSYRFKTSSGAWGWQVVADSDFSLVMSKVSALEITTEGISASVETIKDTYTTHEETTTAITALENSINLSVSNTYSTKAEVADVKSSVSSIQIDLGSITSTVSEVSGKVDSQGEALDAYNERTTTVEQTLSGVTTTVTNIDKDLASTKKKVTTLETSVDKISASVSNVETDLGSTKTKVSSLEITTDNISASVSNLQGDVSSQSGTITTLVLKSNEIEATVSSKADSSYTSTSFSYKLTSSQFTVSDEYGTILKCNKNGLTINGSGTFTGTITASAGYIGDTSEGFKIASTSISNGKTSYNDSRDGIWISTVRGISLGANNAFRVDTGGNLTAKSATIIGKITANEGRIGGSSGFIIDENCIRKTITSLTDTTHDGIYIGTDGIALGKGSLVFKADGSITATKLKVTSGQIESLDASKITAGTIATARLASDVITTSNFSAQNINASQITSGTISASLISTDLLRANELSNKIANLAYLHVGNILVFKNTKADADIMQVPKGDGSGTMISITAKDILRAVGKG